jgi:hypothetical protein
VSSLALYLFVGACWLPVVWIQIRLRDLAAGARDAGEPLPAQYHRLFQIWFILGWPAFAGVIAIFVLMIAKLPLEIDALSLLSEGLNFDFAGKGMDEPLTTDELTGMQGMLGIRDGVLRKSGKTNPTARDFIVFSGRGQTESAIVGGPKDIADVMEEMFTSRGCDGFVVAATHVPGAYADFVRHVVPELQRRGLYHKDYAGKTLRENLGLPRPPIGAWKMRPTAAAEYAVVDNFFHVAGPPPITVW